MRIHNNKAIPLTLLLGSIILAIAFVLHPHAARAAATYTVDSIGDEVDDNPGDLVCHTALDTCTLRAAIEEVNAGTGGDTINFGIAGTGVHTLTPASGYPTIAQSVTIDGYSQPGAVANTAVSPNPFNGTLTIEIDGTSAGNSSGLVVKSSDVTIKGLVINRFTRYGIEIKDFSNVKIEGNYIGTDPTGLIDRSNTLEGIAGNCCSIGNSVVGGPTPASRNIISGNGGFSISINSNMTVQGNYMGPDASGTAVIPNAGDGYMANLIIFGLGNNIGGASTGSANVIAGTPVGVSFFGGSNSTVQGNYIGTNPSGEVQAGFGGIYFGVLFFATSQNNLIGGIGAGEGNIIAGNGAGVGVSDYQGGNQALNNSILGNSIHDNSGGPISTLGIDLLGNSNDGSTFSAAGVTANDSGDPDVTSNVLMNFPVIQSVTSTNGTATITYDLDINDAEPGATGYRVEFFANDSADASGYGEGQTYLGSDTVAGDVTGQQVTITLPPGVDGSKYITATTTMTTGINVGPNEVQVQDTPSGFGHTSEFAADVQATLIPTPTPGPTPTPAPSGNSSSLADTGQAQHKSNTLLTSVLLIAAGLVGISFVMLNMRKAK